MFLSIAFDVLKANLGKGLINTLEIFFLTLLFSLPLGVLIYLARASRFTILRGITKIFISIMRGTPLMLQLMFFRFGPYYLFGLPNPDVFITVIISFSINYAAYFAEIYRGGFESIDGGQYEAARLLGFTRAGTFFKIILPQVVKRIMPTMTNEVITLLKDTSLAMAISYVELLQSTKALAAKESSMLPYLIVGIIYYVLNYLIAFFMERMEKRMSYYR
ncbi:MAG: amino acid ABC transporter permease [Eubacteriales bacterium]|nr:amino acid ABC transporter permease [Eubacteriales bacterium]